MIEIYLRTFIIKNFLFLLNLLSFTRIEVDTQQLMFPFFLYTCLYFYKIIEQVNFLVKYFIFS